MSNEEFSIWPPYEMFYMESMLFITESVTRSVEAASAELQKFAAESPDFEQNQTLNHLQNIVVQGAALARYFWPVRKGHEKRGEALRRAFGITDSSPLKSRDLRNEIEHFDEKLDAYLANGIVGYIVPHYIGPFSESEIPGHLFRAYYSDCGIFEVLGKRFEIEPLVAEVARVHDHLGRARDGNGRLPRVSQ